jgi:dTDP-4-dehydrorhamnose reductase
LPDTLLITGGSGYLGSHVARQAVTHWRVVATRFNRTVALPGCEVVAIDLEDAGAVAALVRTLRPRAVIHTASDMSSPEAMQSVIVQGTRNVAAAAAASGARLIHLSSDMVFDGEHAPYSPGDLPQPVTPYGRAKAAAERIVAEQDATSAIVRTSLIYGFDLPDPRTLWVLESLRRRLPITLFTDEVRCPVWVEQLAAALLELARGDQPGIWHLAGSQPISRYDLGERLARTYDLDPSGITPGLSHASGLVRPRDLTLDIGKSLACLRSPLWGVDQVLARRPSAAPGQ